MKWGDEWQLTFNAAKCKVLHVGRHAIHHDYHLRDTELQVEAVEKDLGVFVDTDLKFRKQATMAVKKASQVMVVIRQSFCLLDNTTLPLLFKTLVRPLLEYGNIVCGPFNQPINQLPRREGPAASN